MSSNTTAVVIDPGSAYAKENNLPAILVPVLVIHTIALTFVGMRFYVRRFMTNSFQIDDALMITGAIFTLGGTITFIAESFYGLGRHQDTIPIEDYIQYSIWNFVQTIVAHTTGFTLVKISIALSLLRLSKNKVFFWVVWPMIAIFALSGISAYFSFFLRCIPLRGLFDKRIKAHCYPVKMFVQMALTNTGINMTTDVLCATLPIPVIWKLQMKLRTRLYLVLIFSLGYLAVAMGILKTVYQLSYAKTPDQTFRYGVQFWGFLQINVAIIAACSPMLKPLIGGFLRLNPTTNRSGDPSRSRTGGASGAGKPWSRNLRTIGGGFMVRNGDGAVVARGPYQDHNDLEAASGSEEAIELTGKALGDSNDGYRTSIRGGRTGVPSAVSSGSGIVDGGESRAGSQEIILDRSREGIFMTKEFKISGL